MLAHGIDKAGFDLGEGFEDDSALMARRPVLEAVVRRVVRGEPGAEVRSERVDGLVATNESPVPRVIGLRTPGGLVPADVVIDCCGRRSLAPKWLAEIGAGLALNHYQPCDVDPYRPAFRNDRTLRAGDAGAAGHADLGRGRHPDH